MKRPNFFIVGAPKSGTSALTQYLGEHPKVYMCVPKEPRYFVEELDSIRATRTLQEYLRLFEGASSQHLAVGEASVWYLYYTRSLERIYEFDRTAKLIVMLRDPVDMVYALHSQGLVNHQETERDFGRAWRLQAARANGENIPKGCPDYRILMYARIGRLGDQVERLLSIFRREQVKFIVYDDFVASTRNEYHETLDFLGVPDDGRVVFPIVNPNKRLRSRKLDALRRKIRPLWRAGSRLKRRLGFQGHLGLMPRVQRLLQSVEPRPRLASEFRRELALEFRDDTGKLEGLIGRSLQSWASHPQSRD